MRAERDAYGNLRYCGVHLDCVEALMFMGARKSEMMTLRWDAIDLERRTITLTDFKGVTRSDIKDKEFHIPEALLKLLQKRPLAPRVRTRVTDEGGAARPVRRRSWLVTGKPAPARASRCVAVPVWRVWCVHGGAKARSR